MNNIKTIAIVGAGISGLTAAYLLCREYDITLFETNNYIGGHTNTVDVYENDKKYAIDTGFIVFNEKTYPNFIKLLKLLDVKKQKSNMSFSVSSHKNNLEYSGDTLNSLFSQRKNLANPKFYRLLYDLYQFNKNAKKFIQQETSPITLKAFAYQKRYSDYFNECYLNPLASAIWSTPISKVDHMPAQFLLSFYNNHGLLDIKNRPQWYVIKNGSREYIKKIIRPFSDKIILNEPVIKVKRTDSSITIKTKKSSHEFDAVVLACHSDQAMHLLEKPSEAERQILTHIPYTKNTAILHTDIKALPYNQRAWASWNYIHTKREEATLTYYMNKLQSIKSQQPYCVSINNKNIDQDKIIKTFNYTHPLYNQKSVAAKKNHALINNQNRTFYVGAYWGNGFHEDGVLSSLNALSPLAVGL